MKTAVCLLAGFVTTSAAFARRPVPASPPDANNNVTWTNPSSSKPPVKQSFVKGDTFYWTNGSVPGGGTGAQSFTPSPAYGSFTCPKSGDYAMFIPKDPDITDYTSTDKKGNVVNAESFTASVSLPRQFRPLEELRDADYSYPWLASLDGGPAIFVGVDLSTYIDSNVGAFASRTFTQGQTLSDLGVSIVNGQIPGVPGLYFSTSELGYDPSSPSGFGIIDGSSSWLDSAEYEASYGLIGVTEVGGSSLPEPATFATITIGGILAIAKRRRSTR